MELTIEIKDDLYKHLRTLTEVYNFSINEAIEKAILLLVQKRAMVRKLMNETCDEFDDAMKMLAELCT